MSLRKLIASKLPSYDLSGEIEVDGKFWPGTDESGFVDAENCSEWKSEADIGAVGLSTAID